ncbi:hypothetical protein, partial [Streptomyces olivaceus]|uniref:hypothetical protein n=1 Tax=Streptomyces olivaceus TaxID=47716 RepID=UPI001CCA7306
MQHGLDSGAVVDVDDGLVDVFKKLFSKARAVSAAFGVTRLVVRSERLCRAGVTVAVSADLRQR